MDHGAFQQGSDSLIRFEFASSVNKHHDFACWVPLVKRGRAGLSPAWRQRK